MVGGEKCEAELLSLFSPSLSLLLFSSLSLSSGKNWLPLEKKKKDSSQLYQRLRFAGYSDGDLTYFLVFYYACPFSFLFSLSLIQYFDFFFFQEHTPTQGTRSDFESCKFSTFYNVFLFWFILFFQEYMILLKTRRNENDVKEIQNATQASFFFFFFSFLFSPFQTF